MLKLAFLTLKISIICEKFRFSRIKIKISIEKKYTDSNNDLFKKIGKRLNKNQFKNHKKYISEFR